MQSRHAEARLAKYGSEASVDADLTYSLPMKHGGGTRSRHSERPRGDSRVEGKRRGSCAFRGPFRHTRTLRTPWVVLPRIKDISPRKRVTCDKNGGSHGRDWQVHEILSPGLRSRCIRRNSSSRRRSRYRRSSSVLLKK